VGLGVGLVVGGTVGRVFMRILFLAREENGGFATAMGAIIGDFTRAGTIGIYAFAAIAGVALGLAYAVARTLLPSGTRLRVTLFTVGTTAFMLGQIVRGNRDDFAFLPVTFSLILIVVSIAITAAPVPLLIERLAPDRERNPGRVARSVVMIGMTGFALFAVTGIVMAYSQPQPF
jgi:uncharacterized membrane protein (UPF0136 family)